MTDDLKQRTEANPPLPLPGETGIEYCARAGLKPEVMMSREEFNALFVELRKASKRANSD